MWTPPLSVAVLVPAGEAVKTQFTIDLLALMQHSGTAEVAGVTRKIKMGFACVIGASTPHNRCLLAEQTLRGMHKFMLYLDGDMTFPPDTAERLLQAALSTGAGIAGCNYPSRFEGQIRRGMTLCKQGDRLASVPAAAQGVIEVERLPTGVMLVRREVFESLDRPWFKEVFGGGGTYESHDFYFCRCARERGVKIVCATDLSRRIGHIGSMTYTLDEGADMDRIRSRSVGFQ